LQDSYCLKTSLMQMWHKTTSEAHSNKQCDRHVYQNNIAQSCDIFKLLPILRYENKIRYTGTLWPLCSCICST
jgi:hypothetical protein